MPDDSWAKRHDNESRAAADRWGDILRVIGRFLDREEARDVTIKTGETVDVVWQNAGAAQGTTITRLDMNKLREQAPLMRQPIAAPPNNDREELLRTLGQELDDQGMSIRQVVERATGYEVHGSDSAGSAYRFYSLSELRQLSVKRQAMRGTGAVQAPTRGTAP